MLALAYITFGDPVTVAFANVSGYRTITIPDPPRPPSSVAVLDAPPPPPPPVLTVPGNPGRPWSSKTPSPPPP